MPTSESYRGQTRKLVLAFDVGTTYSGISYCILDPGEVPKIHGVWRYPAQEHVGGDNKIPSILYYDRQGVVKAVWAEALQQHIIEQAEDEGWDKLERWKLHLQAKHLTSSHVRDEDIPLLPQGKSAVEVLGDFMRYLFSCARTYITESHANGTSIWKSMENDVEFVLTYPNEWEELQQQQIRHAAMMAGLVPRGNGHAGRIHLLTEGEASLHFCVTHMLAPDALSNLSIVSADGLEDEVEEVEGDQGIVIIDAGDGTIDLSAYSVRLSPQREFKEIAPAERRLQGFVFVTQQAHAFLKAKLANSQYGSPEIVQRMNEIFDQTTKLRFRDADSAQYIQFGTVIDKDPQYGIRSGQLKFEDVFGPSIEAITGAFEKQRQAATKLKIRIKHAFLVGSYAASDFLYCRLQQHPVFSDVHLCRPSSHVNRAVADGAVSSLIDPLVISHLRPNRTADEESSSIPGRRPRILRPDRTAHEQSSSMHERQLYQGPARKLVLAFDVGTTYSGVSYSILDPGELPVICGVTRFPDTDHVCGNKIPSIVYYDIRGVPRAFGCEALQESMIDKAEEEGWFKVEWWKLHLRPKNMPHSHVSDQDVAPLPPSRTAAQILSDFMGYLFRCAKTYIQETHASGPEMWASFENNIDFVFSHPNGWEDQQKTLIRRAAVVAGLVPDSPGGQACIQLVTEGEASLYFCLSTEKTGNSFEEDQGVMVIDAGGGTVDVSSYYMTTSPITLQKIAPAECHLQGSVFVTRRAQQFLSVKLSGSKYGNLKDIAQMADEFDRETKLCFSNSTEPAYIRFGSSKDRDVAYNIKSGQLKLAGAEVATLFEPSIVAIIASIDNQRRLATKPISSIFLVGGFAASDWLFSKLQEHIKPLNLDFCRPDSHINKAVSHGALAFYLDHRKFNENDEQDMPCAASPDAFRATFHQDFRTDFTTDLPARTGSMQSNSSTKEIQKLKEEVAQLRASQQKAVDEYNTLLHSLECAQKDKATLEQALRREEEGKNQARLEMQRLRAELDAARHQREGEVEIEPQHWQTKYDELTTFLEARTRELKAAQVHLTNDTISCAEVITLVDALNDEILQTSAFISDSFAFACQEAHADEIREASIRISRLVGSSLTHLLSTVLHREDPLLVQIALQGATVELSRRIIMTWNFADPQAEQPLAEVYSDIRETEAQAVGGRWRALTRAHGRKIALQRTDLHATTVARISDTLVDVLVAAGCTKTYDEAYRMFARMFGEQISNIVKMASRLNKAMGEEVTSADLWPTCATPGTKFDGALMEEFGTDGQDSQGKTILCTTALGLQRSEKVVQGNTVDFETTTLLKPKVVLESVADALEREEA